LDSFIYVTVYTLEAFCTITASYLIFRFPFKEFIWKKLILSILLATNSYLLRDITIVNEFTVIVPMIYLVAYTLFIHYFSKIRILWASIVMVTGYAFVGTVQMVILFLFDAVLGIEMARIQANLFYLAFAQVLTAIIALSCSLLYYYRGSGFTYEFPSWRWKHLWLVLLELLLIALIFRFILINNLSIFIAVVITISALLLLSRKMEREERLHELEP